MPSQVGTIALMTTTTISSQPMVSIIVPVYNAGSFLHACVASLLAQTYSNIEILLVNDGSTDGSDAICDEFAASDKRVRVIHQVNGGIGRAQNAGLDAARGELITFCDNDDLMSPLLVTRLTEMLLENDADMACCKWYNVGASVATDLLKSHSDDPPGEVIVFNSPASHYQSTFSVVIRRLFRRELKYFSEANWGKLYRASLFSGLRFPEGQYAQDVAVAMPLYNQMQRVASCSDRLYFWLQRADSVSHNLRSTAYYHDIIDAHISSFEVALGQGVLPARAFYGLTAVRAAKRSVTSPEELAVYKNDRARVRSMKRRLGIGKYVACQVLCWIRQAETKVYDRTVHRRS